MCRHCQLKFCSRNIRVTTHVEKRLLFQLQLHIMASMAQFVLRVRGPTGEKEIFTSLIHMHLETRFIVQITIQI